MTDQETDVTTRRERDPIERLLDDYATITTLYHLGAGLLEQARPFHDRLAYLAEQHSEQAALVAQLTEERDEAREETDNKSQMGHAVLEAWMDANRELERQVSRLQAALSEARAVRCPQCGYTAALQEPPMKCAFCDQTWPSDTTIRVCPGTPSGLHKFSVPLTTTPGEPTERTGPKDRRGPKHDRRVYDSGINHRAAPTPGEDAETIVYENDSPVPAPGEPTDG